jgi:hypothetical protein
MGRRAEAGSRMGGWAEIGAPGRDPVNGGRLVTPTYAPSGTHGVMCVYYAISMHGGAVEGRAAPPAAQAPPRPAHPGPPRAQPR